MLYEVITDEPFFKTLLVNTGIHAQCRYILVYPAGLDDRGPDASRMYTCSADTAVHHVQLFPQAVRESPHGELG